VGGLFTAGGVHGLMELSKRNKGLSQIGERAGIILLSSLSFGIGVPFIIGDFMKNKQSKTHLSHAVEAYISH